MTTDEKIAMLMDGIPRHTASFTRSPSRLADEPPAGLFDTDIMKIEVCWENAEETIIRYTFSGEWDWDDFYQILEQRDPSTLGQDVDVIVDFRGISFAPSDAVLHLKRAAKMAEKDNNMIVLITNSATIATLYQAFVTMYKTVGKRMRIVNNDAEAFALLDALKDKRD